MDSTFSLESYRALLELALRHGWTFVRFCELAAPGSERKAALRHDIDYSIEMAYEMALVNESLGVRATFLFLLRSDLYNLLSARSLDRVQRIHDAGQLVGLHLPCPPHAGVDEDGARQWVACEFELLRRVAPYAEPVFAWHNPPAPWLERFRSLEVPGLVNAYGAGFTQDCLYRSDSNLRNSVADFASIFESADIRRLHWLVHPLNWVVGGRDMGEIFARAWKRVIREHEAEFMSNTAYARLMPQGMPAEMLATFSNTWKAHARAAG